ncbi:MAG: hypothetical protein QOE70_6652 [Chthoniobacter sp.]|nr:hypothetical protein [Chthoniobacter sp.]
MKSPKFNSVEEHLPSKPKARGTSHFRRIIVGSVLSVATIATLVYFGAESPDLDLTGTPKVNDCPIHHLPLVVARAPITYEEPNDWDRNYFHASKVSFPHAGMIVFASSFDSSEWPCSYRFARVWQCPECVRAEKQWFAGDGKLRAGGE